MLYFRRSNKQDIDSMLEVIEDAVSFLHEQGVDQWQRGYPNRAALENDIAEGISWVVLDDEMPMQPLALCAIRPGEEACYRTLTDGCWRNETGAYVTIHRIAVRSACRGRGLAAFLYASAEEQARKMGAVSVRVDTHPDNLVMQRTLAKAGYVRCGALTLVAGPEAGNPRLGFEKLL